MHTKSDSTLSFRNKLQQLTEFNQALVYGFDPESSPNYQLGSKRYQDEAFPTVGQFEDMLEGYLFAQNELLPAFRKIEEGSLDEITFINYIKQLHGYIGSTLLGLVKEKSGEFTQDQLMRWNPDNTTDLLTNLILSEMTHSSLNGKNPTTVLIELLTTTLNLSEAQVQQFIALLFRIKNDATIIPRASQIKAFNDSSNTAKSRTVEEKEKLAKGYSAAIIKEKLAVAYLSNKFSTEEKELVNKIVTICRDPEETPKLMDDFAKATLASWRKCDKKDLKAVSQCLAEMFYQFTDIHPFGNANGRTATCLVNVFLRSIGLPSILMRNPGERDDSASSYSKAIDAINQTREPLTNHIYRRILEAQKHAFSDEKLAEAVTLRCEMVHKLKSLQSKYPQIDINIYKKPMHEYILKLPELRSCPIEDQQIFVLNQGVEYIAKEEKRLEQSSSKEMAKVTSSIRTTTSACTQPGQLKQGFFTSVKTEGNKALDAAKAEKCSDQSLSKGKTTVTGFIGTTILSDGEKEQLKQDLLVLTKSEGWKINKNNHLESWIELHNEAEAKDVFKLLNAAGVGNVILSKRKDNQNIHVVKCSNINLSELKNKIKLNNAAEAAAPDSQEPEVNNAAVQ